MSKNGDILNDSHAEIMCRRGFLRYLYEQIDRSILKEDSIFSFDDETKRFTVSTDVSFHFFTTYSPCGDASIFSADEPSDEPAAKRPKIETETETNDETFEDCASQSQNFTGAKIVYTSTDVPFDLIVQTIGQIRTKPGRGQPTLSISCSDKLAKWNVLGIQGALIHSLINKPIYMSSVTLGDPQFCDPEATERAVWKRFSHTKFTASGAFFVNQPTVQICKNIQFEHQKSTQREPAPGSIVWCKILKNQHQVAVNGKRQGVTKKSANTPKGRLTISKIELFRCYLDILKRFNHKLNIHPTDTDFNSLRYCDAKKASHDYHTVWNDLKLNYFHVWSTKPDELNSFKID